MDMNEVLEITPINKNNLSKPINLKKIKGQTVFPHMERDCNDPANNAWLFFSFLLIFATAESSNSDR